MKRLTAALATAAIITTALAFFGLPSASAVGMLDQQQTESTLGQSISDTTSGAQTFTAGITGVLDRAELLLIKTGSPSDLTVEIRTTAQGVPTNTVLATGPITAASVPESSSGSAFVPVTFTAAPAVTAGVQYALVAYVTDPGVNNSYIWGISDDDNYSAGRNFYATTSPPTQFYSFPDFDNAFKTYVSQPTIPTPEPSPSPSPPTATCGGSPATIVGTSGRDTITGTSGPDVIAGLGGADTIKGLGGKDIICGGSGSDALSGGAGRDLLYGGKGKHDWCPGGSGDDKASPGCEASKSADSM